MTETPRYLRSRVFADFNRPQQFEVIAEGDPFVLFDGEGLECDAVVESIQYRAIEGKQPDVLINFEQLKNFRYPCIARASQGGAVNLTVWELMDENAGFEQSAWGWCESMLGTTYHDDSDYSRGSPTVVMYVCTDRDELRLQMDAWREANPDVELEDD